MSYDRKSTHTISSIIHLLRSRSKFTLDGDQINPSSRYQLFVTKGYTCVTCGLEGTYFAKERTPGHPKYHLNLYGKNHLGEEVMLTKDHIIPKSRGGENRLHNYQTMCQKCNGEKGNLLPGESKSTSPISPDKK